MNRPLVRLLVASATGLALVLPGLVGVAAPASAADAVVVLNDLQTNGRTEPLGIPLDAPSLSWQATSSSRGVLQTGYQVQVATTEAALGSHVLWDSGQVASDRQVDVLYRGPALTAQTRYYWQVRTWDNGAAAPSAWSTPSYFETGLPSSGWQGDWITSSNPWTDYTTSVNFHLDSVAFGIFFRGADPNDAYMWQLTVADGTPRLKLHTRVNGNYTVLANEDISGTISAQQLMTGDHTFSVTTQGSWIVARLDGIQIDRRSDTTFGQGYVGLRTSGAEAVTVHSMSVTAPGGQTLFGTSFDQGNPFSAGTVTQGDLKLSGDSEAWYTPSLPLLRDGFSTLAGKTIASARVYASARGVYQLSIDGQQVGDQHLAPGDTSYPQRIQSQTYDVTSLLSSGANAIGAELGAGWYAGRDGNHAPGHYGTDTSLIAQLQITYTDGTQQVVSTNPSWTWHSGPFVQADNIDGETYDARRAQPGFDTAGFNDRDWLPVSVAANTTSLLVPQPDAPVRTTQEIPAVNETQAPAGSYIYDLGQEISGVAKVTISGNAGDTVRIRYGEMLNPDGTLYTANLRTAKATDYYTFATTGRVTYTPTFTYHGFRYIEITGASTPPAVSDVTGEVWGSDLARTNTLQTSDPMLNQLASNISWGQRDNFLSIPTDTPARDERLGWLGDINVFAPTADYLVDARAFMQKFTTDMRDAQNSDGSLPGTAPTLGDFVHGGAGWEDAMITVPYDAFQAYGDTAIITQNYPAMQNFFGHILNVAGPGYGYVDENRGTFGDWLALDPTLTPFDLISTAYDAQDARMMSEMAAAIGRPGDAQFYSIQAQNYTAAFDSAFIAADGTVGRGTQTAYALALGMNLVPAAQVGAVGAKFVAKIHADNDHLSTGFLGTPWLLPALSDIGQDALAYTLLENKTYPSWGYEIAKGATTVWERWNSIQPDGSFGDVSMNSFNHYAYGAVGLWMYQHVGGISALAPGYKQIKIAPDVGGGLTHGDGTLDSAYGQIASSWTNDSQQFTLHVEVPVNTTAQVVLPAPAIGNVAEGGGALAGDPGVSGVTQANGTVTLTVGSGSYDFDVASQPAPAGNDFGLGTLIPYVDGIPTMLGSDRQQLDQQLATARDSALRAATFKSAGNTSVEQSSFESTIGQLQTLRTWLANSDLSSSVSSDLDSRVASIENTVVPVAIAAFGITITISPAAPGHRGGPATGSLSVTNAGQSSTSSVTASVTLPWVGWNTTSGTVGGLPPGSTGSTALSLGIAVNQASGSYSASVMVSTTLGSQPVSYTFTSPGWATVSST